MKNKFLLVLALSVCVVFTFSSVAFAAEGKDIIPVAVTASSQADGFAAENAIDGIQDTIWHTDWTKPDTLPHILVMDFGKQVNLYQFNYKPRQDMGNAIITEATLYYSVDGENYNKIGEQVWAADQSIKTYEFEPVNARYLKLNITKGLGAEQFVAASEVWARYNEEAASGIAETTTQTDTAAPVDKQQNPKTGDVSTVLYFTLAGIASLSLLVKINKKA